MTDIRTDAKGRQLPPWEQPEWLAHNARSTDLALPLTVPLAIRLHGDITERIARDRHKLAMLISLRIGISETPDLSESLVAANIRDYEALLGTLSELLYGGS